MIDIELSKEFMAYCREFGIANNLANRGQADGTKAMQLVGIIGQNAINRELGLPMMKTSVRFDGGYDLIVPGLNGKPIKMDVKTMGRNYSVKQQWINNLLDCQLKYDCHGYIFTSLNMMTDVLTICGWIEKWRVKQDGELYTKGTLRRRDNGLAVELRGNNWEIPNWKLHFVDSVQGMVRDIAVTMSFQRSMLEVVE